MAKTMKKLYSKLQKQQQGWTKSQTRLQNTTKMKIWKITTAKFKCTRKHSPKQALAEAARAISAF